jgi:hypothetical protein
MTMSPGDSFPDMQSEETTLEIIKRITAMVSFRLLGCSATHLPLRWMITKLSTSGQNSIRHRSRTRWCRRDLLNRIVPWHAAPFHAWQMGLLSAKIALQVPKASCRSSAVDQKLRSRAEKAVVRSEKDSRQADIARRAEARDGMAQLDL